MVGVIFIQGVLPA